MGFNTETEHLQLKLTETLMARMIQNIQIFLNMGGTWFRIIFPIAMMNNFEF